MTLQNLIQSASVERPSAAVLEQAAVTLNTSLNALLNAFAREVAEGYLDGKYSWEFGDTVMNNLYSCAYVFSDLCLPDFAWNVFAAFDEGEYIHTGESPELDGEPRTKALLLQLIERPGA
jgi:hypothetical protein